MTNIYLYPGSISPLNMYMKKLTAHANKIWAKIVVLFDCLERYKDEHPAPRTDDQIDIIKLFESKILSETKKLKELED